MLFACRFKYMISLYKYCEFQFDVIVHILFLPHNLYVGLWCHCATDTCDCQLVKAKSKNNIFAMTKM